MDKTEIICGMAILMFVVLLIKIGIFIYRRVHQVNGGAPRRGRGTSNFVSSVRRNATEFGPVNYYANDRHHSKDKWFRFLYVLVGHEWRAYILRMPDLNGRSGNLHLTHRFHSPGTYWVCYSPQPGTLKEAIAVSKAWADRELEYIATGTPFENQRW